MTGPTEIPAYGLPRDNRQVLLVRRPQGIPQAEDFAIAAVPRPEPGPGQFLLRNIYLSVDPAQRGWAAAGANYSDPVPIGGVMRALAVGVVVESRAPGIAVGSFLYGWFGWQDYCVATPAQVLMTATAALPLSAHAGLLGINGLTACLALTELGRPVAGETLLVSTAAGAVGSLVGQIGRLLGCRTIGLTGDDTKRQLCLDRFGFDHAYNYRTTDVAAVAKEAGPDGIDVYFDNVGGPILDSVLRHMALRGRIVQCGTASISSWEPPPTGLRNEREVLTRRLSWNGFIIFDHRAEFERAAAKLSRWWADGALHYEEDIAAGIEHAPGAIAGVYAGTNRGKKLIYVG